ncbi:MAG: hypothetical protein ACLUG5_06575 [Clostridia bacterium]|jgi:hypothetical protein
MNKTDSLSEKSCNSIFFEDEAKVLTFACITTENVKDFPLLLGEVGTNKVVAPENAEESKYLVVEGKKLSKQLYRITTKEVAESRVARGRNVTKQKLEAKAKEAKEDDSSR